MPNRSQYPSFPRSSIVLKSVFILSAFCGLTVLSNPCLRAQTFTVLHSFNLNGVDGARADAGLTADRAGNLYGTTAAGGTRRGGMVYKLTHAGQGWVFTPLYQFSGGTDGGDPEGEVVFGPDGALYGTTSAGGDLNCNPPIGCGTVFKLQPSARAVGRALSDWTETVLYRFTQSPNIGFGRTVTFDAAGNVYGSVSHVTSGNDAGGVYELTPSGGGWNETVIYQFQDGDDGRNPTGNLVFDSAGNLYGVTDDQGLYGYGTVFELSHSQSGWTNTTIHAFQDGNDGAIPFAGPIFNPAGNLLGTAASGGANGGGTVFQMAPNPGGGWTFRTLYGFQGHQSGGPTGTLTLDGAGNIYGVLQNDGADNYGSVFKLTMSNGNWSYTDLHDFTHGSDGDLPMGRVVIDASGNVYGTTSDGGEYGYGIVWEITP